MGEFFEGRKDSCQNVIQYSIDLIDRFILLCLDTYFFRMRLISFYRSMNICFSWLLFEKLEENEPIIHVADGWTGAASNHSHILVTRTDLKWLYKELKIQNCKGLTVRPTDQHTN